MQSSASLNELLPGFSFAVSETKPLAKSEQEPGPSLPTPLPTSAAEFSSPRHAPPSSPDCLLIKGFQHSNAVSAAFETRSPKKFPSFIGSTARGLYEAAPIASTPSRSGLREIKLVELPTDGSFVTVGRSSISCDVAVSAKNKLCSRVHARLSYSNGLIVIECLGWNGLVADVPQWENGQRIYKRYQVVKNQVIYIERVNDVVLDLQGDLLRIEPASPASSDATIDELGWLPSSELSSDAENELKHTQQSDTEKLENVGTTNTQGPQNKLKSENMAECNSEGGVESSSLPLPVLKTVYTESSTVSHSEESKPENDMPKRTICDEDLRGTFGAHSDAENRDPVDRKRPAFEAIEERNPKQSKLSDVDIVRIATNHIAFSRLGSTPLSTLIASNENFQGMPRAELEAILENIDCIGSIHIKDGYGKPLETEYYYVPEKDLDEARRQLAQESAGGSRTIRACRKINKQYFIKNPKKARRSGGNSKRSRI